MSNTTLGRVILQAARGSDKEVRTTRDETGKLQREMAARVSPKIDSIRAEQRRAFEESKSVILF